MKNDVLKYSLTMDKTLKTAIESDTKYRVVRIKKLPSGSMNHVFRVETDQGTIVARVFSKKDFPDIKKLVWIDNALRKANIDTAKILFCTKETKPFRFGYMLAEFVEGKNGWNAMRSEKISLPRYFERFGTLMKRIHAIKFTKDCPLLIGQPYNNYKWFKEVLGKYALKSLLSKEEHVQIQNFVISTLSHYAHRFKNVLSHCDPGPQNNIYTKDGRIVLIDWDLAEADSFLRDLSAITLDSKKMNSFGKTDVVASQIQKAFLKGYGPTGFTTPEIQLVTDAHHIISYIYNVLAYPPKGKNINLYKKITKKIIDIINKQR